MSNRLGIMHGLDQFSPISVFESTPFMNSEISVTETITETEIIDRTKTETMVVFETDLI